MKILLISSYLPYPLFSGGQVRLYNLLQELSRHHEITLICEKRSHQTDADVKAVEKVCKKVITVPRYKQWSIKNILGAASSSHSFLVTGHTHKEMQREIAAALTRDTFDLIHVETFYVMQNVPETDVPIVLAEHNIEYLVYKRFMESKPSIIRPLLALDIAKMKKEEEAAWKRATKLVAVSHEDKTVMEQAGFQPIVVSNGVNTDSFTYKDLKRTFIQKEKRILFIGDYSWIQNRDTAAWIISDIWPQMQNSEVKLWIVGRNIPESLKKLTGDPSVLFDEAVSASPAWEIFQRADILLAPIRVGGGTSYKILESMACGTPVVTMQLSAKSIQAEDGREIMIGQTAKELADKTLVLLHDKHRYEKISKNGRALIEERYTWKAIANVLDGVYKSVYL